MDRNIILLTVLTLIAIFMYGVIDYQSEPWSGMDLKYYRQMAGASPGLAPDVPRPFSYRLLGPYLAGLAGGQGTAGFFALTVLSSLSLVILMYRIFLFLKISPSASVIAVTLFILNKHLFGTGNWNLFQVKDTMSMAIMAASLLAIYRDRHVLLGVLLTAGSMTGELTMLMIPVLAVYRVEKGMPARSTLKALAWCLPAVALFAGIRLFVPAAGGMGLARSALHYGAKLQYPMVWFGLLVNPFIPSTLLPFVLPRNTLCFAREHLHLAVMFLLVLAGAAFGSNNERLMAPSAPAFYALVACLLDSPAGRKRPVRAVTVAAAVVASAHHTIARFPLPSRMLTAILSLSALAAVTIVFIYFSLNQSSSQEGSGSGLKSRP